MIRNHFRIDILDLKIGKTVNWLCFKVHAGKFNINIEYTVDFCGTELHTNIPLSEYQREQLLDKLKADFGYAPYNINSLLSLAKDKSYMIAATEK